MVKNKDISYSQSMHDSILAEVRGIGRDGPQLYLYEISKNYEVSCFKNTSLVKLRLLFQQYNVVMAFDKNNNAKKSNNYLYS